MTAFAKMNFTDADVKVDGNQYEECQFNNCTVIYSGGLVPSFSNCSFDGSRFSFDEAAGRTVALLQAWARPGSGFTQVVLDTFPELFGHDPGTA